MSDSIDRGGSSAQPAAEVELPRYVTRAYGALFWLYFVLINIVLFPGALLLFIVVGPFDRQRRLQHLYSCLWAQMYFYINPFWSLQVTGRHHLPKKAAVIVVNHESLGDILALFGLYSQFKWVSKASVFRVPIIGWNMRFSRYIPLVRRNRRSIGVMMDTCRAWLADDMPVLFFPEGTRSPDGEVQAFKDGAFMLAHEQGYPVVPLALTGMADCLPKHSVSCRVGARAHITVLPPVESTAFADVESLRDHVRDLIVAEKSRLVGDA